MAQFYTELDDRHMAFIREQKLFFTATAPAEGRINLSPKGMDTFRCLDAHTVAYLDLTGSGNETSAHLEENGRLTLMFCSFTRAPMILRLYGRGEVVRPRDPAWEALASHFEVLPGTRQIIVQHVESVQTSCGYAVPFFTYEGERDTLRKWAEHKGDDGLTAYRREKNQASIDGLPTHLLADSE